MKFFKPWLQDYIVETLPQDEVITEALNKKAFEVEETIKTEKGTVFDIKVLPNRAHDALGHHGMAYELCSCLGLTFKNDSRDKEDTSFFDKSIPTVLLSVEDEKACTRFMSVQIDNVAVGESPAWLKERLEAIGQRSINNIVDVTNYVQFALNKPMHAYDTRSIKGTLSARFARTGETLVTLDEKSLSLDEATLVIADDEKVLGLAGIKGGKFSGIQSDTTSVILESANFEPVLIRKTAQKYDLRTDASKRFENGIANNLIIEGLYMTANLIKEICKDAKMGEVTDIYPKKDMPYHVGFSKSELNDVLGTSYTEEKIEETLSRLGFTWKKIIPQEEIVRLANRALGAPYHLGSSVRFDAPTMFDCSSLTSWLYVHSGVSIPRMSIDQYVYTERVESSDLKIGDLIFANNNHDAVYTSSIDFLPGTVVPEGINHVGIYVGDGNVIHATSMYEKVVIENLGTSPRFASTVGYGRVLNNVEEERYVIEAPEERLDIRIKEDIIEEIGRIIGYDKLVPALSNLTRVGLPHKRLYYENKIREILLANGFSEVITYTFGDKGAVELKKGLADDKEKLRDGLSFGLMKALETNLYNAPLLGKTDIKIFEFGNVFSSGSEKRNLALGSLFSSKKLNDKNVTILLEKLLLDINNALSLYYKSDSVALGVNAINGYILNRGEVSFTHIREIDFDNLLDLLLPAPTTYEAPSFSSLPVVTYKSVSAYPFVTRDIAMWVSADTTWESVHAICVEVRNPLVSRIDLFDTFSKEIEGVKKTSYAFRLVFQSYEKTLTDDEVNQMMEAYYKIFKEKGYEIR